MITSSTWLPKPGTYSPRVSLPETDAYGAMAGALARYLRAQTFSKYAGPDEPNTKFELCYVTFEWPEPSQELEYPSASIIDTAGMKMLAHNFVPAPLARTWHLYGENTVLWKLHEASIVFQVDFWVENAADREAVALALPSMFAPGETRSNIVVLASDKYYCAPVKLYLESYQRMDTSASVFNKERRLMTMIRADIDVLDLRRANEVYPEIKAFVTQDKLYEKKCV